MAKKKSVSLLEQLSHGTPLKTGKRPWWVEFKSSSPDQYQQLLDVVKDFEQRGRTFQANGSRTALLRRLKDIGAVPSISDSSFRAFCEFVVQS
jgi:hypothetical protein